jgi:hypothetical protein
MKEENMVKCIAFKSGYKYQLKTEYSVEISIKPPELIQTAYITLDVKGLLTLRSGYAWDGPSGPTIDTPAFMRGSLVHDALYQLMRENHLDLGAYREAADRTLQTVCREDGMWGVRAWWVYQGVRLFGRPAADPSRDKPITYAPGGCEQ